MSEIDAKVVIIEDFETLLEARNALRHNDSSRYNAIASEIEQELGAEYCTQLQKKILRWVEATVVARFFDRGPPRFYIQAKMLYRDGYYEAAIMLSRSTAEMVCYDRLSELSHPFGTHEEVEKKNFRTLIKWLRENDSCVNDVVFENLSKLYDIGNNYVHPKAGQNPLDDSLKSLHLLGEAVFEIYGVKKFEEMIGCTVRSAYCDFPDINSGTNFMLTGFLSPEAALRDANRHKNKPGDIGNTQ